MPFVGKLLVIKKPPQLVEILRVLFVFILAFVFLFPSFVSAENGTTTYGEISDIVPVHTTFNPPGLNIDQIIWVRVEFSDGPPMYFRCSLNLVGLLSSDSRCTHDDDGGSDDYGSHLEREAQGSWLGQKIIEGLFAIVLWILQLSIWILGLAGTLMEFVINNFVLRMSEFVGRGGIMSVAVVSAWTALRDIANIAFIGGLVWASIAMILNIVEAKASQLIVKILVAALLVNFSFFFAGIIVDASNFIAGEVYEAGIQKSADNAYESVAPESINFSQSGVAGLGAVFMEETRLSSVISPDGLRSEDPTLTGFLIAVLAIVLFSITAYVFFTVTFLLIARFVVLTILLITSPIGILRWTGLPFVSNLGKEWWDALISQSIFAPVFFLFVGIAMTVIASLSEITGSGTLSSLASQNFADVNEAIGVLALFAVSIGFMWASLVIARNLSQQAKSFNPIYGGVNRLRDWSLSGLGSVNRLVGRGVGAVGESVGGAVGGKAGAEFGRKTLGGLYGAATLPLSTIGEKAASEIAAKPVFNTKARDYYKKPFEFEEKSYDFDSKELQKLSRRLQMADYKTVKEEFDNAKTQKERENIFFAARKKHQDMLADGQSADTEVQKGGAGSTENEPYMDGGVGPRLDTDKAAPQTLEGDARINEALNKVEQETGVSTQEPLAETKPQDDTAEIKSLLQKIVQGEEKSAEAASKALALEIKDQKRERIENRKLVTALSSKEYTALKNGYEKSGTDTGKIDDIRYEELRNQIKVGDEAAVRAGIQQNHPQETLPEDIAKDPIVVKVQNEIKTSPSGIVGEAPRTTRQPRQRPSKTDNEEDNDN
ncbi:hypothetical protein COU15_02820 [Candidatus Kaiserbacteria bacterium CG10_big_fil_rev_8_21_14_0_10_45_20]|uniref:TrbL/VirB6 plasmid conjugal transfer protein n=1 Tax=Candidatus Kaiserbacteria bacterium CG10_big_fil_rev_8_21_14_0_10_45_20 TaxID=1974607 RepID=A0A2H0UFB4_9BACT|nr:MAG: hypothetical protein COU15_02820 [Candidatus Kaiserbacteria bacterium CG10_big_fil_rev_8_21_14_0_10_45_20]